MTRTVAITGNTYPVKDAIKTLGGRWNADRKAWMVPAAKADEAQALVAGAPAKTKTSHNHNRGGRGACAECGAPSNGYYRCYDCSLDHRDGGSRHMGGMSYTDRHGRFVLGDDD